MRKYGKLFWRGLLAILLITPVAAWSFYKPVRVLAPELNNMVCLDDQICIEEPIRNEEAQTLYIKAFDYVNNTVSKIGKKPRALFCSTDACYASFGFQPPAKAKTVGNFGIVISPKGWTEIFLRHEMIHHLQIERLGAVSFWRAPDWLKEGMAYSLSNDTRDLKQPWSDYREKFENWYMNIEKKELWNEAKNLKDKD